MLDYGLKQRSELHECWRLCCGPRNREIPLAGAAASLAPWGVATIASYARSGNLAATYAYTGPTFGAGQSITIAGLAFHGSFTISRNDGDAGHVTVPNIGFGVATTPASGTATLTSAQVVVTPRGILNGSTTYD